MKEYASFLAGPICLLTLLCGVAIFLGTDPWRVASAMLMSVPIAGYVGFSMFTLSWTINVGRHQTRTLKAAFYYWHGVSVMLAIILSAAGSFIVLFALAIRGLTGGAF